MPEQNQTKSVRPRATKLLPRERGATTLEFVLILPFFLFVVFMIIEFGLVFVAQELLDNAARDGARQLRIGTLSGSSYSTALTTAVCNDLTFTTFSLLPSCTTTIQIYVAAAPSGSPAGTGFLSLKTAAVTGTSMVQTKAAVSANYDVLMQIAYPYPWQVPGLSLLTGTTLLTSTIAFQTEPY
ncbi:TadE/TadG family type IV pilus assembly protein [Paraburkholderia pallida]|uniref:Pilus assembly protein n=1 Tax=Paraburkholderia pallida TaxID=2547399 RepID=A0A4P7D228_9BURK|nr:TadE/TadG family type IV pilus assembly protein [Paraburkholderia pallida]QBR01257.1 pilus assembly protein [Paraburkholderia pallida]